jgi:predicted phage gp36 major capsid-like protein
VTTVTDAKSLGIRKRSADMADANWTTEVAAVTEDTTMAFGRRDLTPAGVEAGQGLDPHAPPLDRRREGDQGRVGVQVRRHRGEGVHHRRRLGPSRWASSPPTPAGSATGRDVTASSATAFTADDLINMKFNLKQGYQQDKSTAWVVSREFVKRARKLKVATTTGGNDLEYIWQPGLTDGAPDRILDIPYNMSEYAPNTFTTGLYVAVLGSFRFYRIAQVADMMLQRLVELYAATNEVGFIGRRWVDGAPVLEEAFTRLKLA